MKQGCRIVALALGLLTLAAGGAWAEMPKGQPVAVTGRIVDNVCWLTMGQIGEGHRECAMGCDKAGVRMALLDEKNNILYTLMADKPFVDPNSLIRPHFERIVVVKGDLYNAPGGQKVLAVKEVTEQVAANPRAAKNPCAAKKNPCAARAACAGAYDGQTGSNFGACSH
jgi:hypothetical protein